MLTKGLRQAAMRYLSTVKTRWPHLRRVPTDLFVFFLRRCRLHLMMRVAVVWIAQHRGQLFAIKMLHVEGNNFEMSMVSELPAFFVPIDAALSL